jgi:hypothetical protein
MQEKSDCLTRESPIVQANDGLRRNRKALLSDLSSLVKAAKRLQDVANGVQAAENIEILVDEMILKAFKIVNRAVKFLDLWHQDRLVRDSISNRTSFDVPPTPPADTLNFTHSIGVSSQTDSNAAAVRSDQVTPVADGSGHIQEPSFVSDQQQTKRLSQKRISELRGDETRPPSPQAVQPNSRPSSMQGKRQSVSHRVSYTGHTTGSRNAKLASERLKTTHDAFLMSQASFVGRLHLQSRSSSELLLTTQQSVVACRDLLSVVEAVWNRDSQRSEQLQMAKDTMYSRITDLVQITRDTFRKSNSAEEADEMMLPDAGKDLMVAATGCVWAAGDCVAKTKFVLERIGDFEFESIGLGISSVIDENPLHESTFQEVSSEEFNSAADIPLLDRETTSTPPQPSSRPPPPPAVNLQIVETSVQPVQPTSSNSISTDGTELVTPILTITDIALQIPDPASTKSLLPPLPNLASPLMPQGEFSPIDSDGGHSFSEAFDPVNSYKLDGGFSSNGTNSTYLSGNQDFDTGIVSHPSTRATTPDQSLSMSNSDGSLATSGKSIASSQTTLTEDFEEAEAKLLEKTFAHELIYNKDGQISGGTLPALVERMTTHDSTPDSMFVSTFYLTFRLFASPTQLAEALIDRFDYVGENSQVSTPVRLRVYNVFKGWIESHWRGDTDREALDAIYTFSIQKLAVVIPAAGNRLIELADKVSAANAPLVPRLVSSIGKTNTSISQYIPPDTPLPPSIISRSQLNNLKNWKSPNHQISIMDFDPLEFARQLTIKESKIFCAILPEELLGTEWNKKTNSTAVNVRAKSTLSTDLANLVADTILVNEDQKKRAAIIKQWVKIAKKCLLLNNYDSLMAIICSLNSSTILRLKKTWEIVSQKTKVTLENLRTIMDVSKNYSVLRQRLQNQVPPCLPFVGTYLTDLTFVDVGNQTTRHLPGDGVNEGISVINFSKHTQTARIIGDLQRFQIPYRLQEIPDFQEWLEAQIQRVQGSDEANIQSYYRRSLRLEPREQTASRPSPVESQQSSFSATIDKQKFDFLSWTHSSKEKGSASGATTPT